MMRARAVGGLEVALLVSIGVFWGLNWPAVRIALTELPPLTLRAIGFSAGALLLALVVWWRGERLWPRRVELPALILTSLFSVLGFNVFTAYGQLHTETSRAAIIAFTMPVWATLLAVVWLGERLTRLRSIALLLGMGGLGLLLGQDLFAVGRSPLGTLLVLGAALSWAVGTILLKRRRWSLTALAQGVWLMALSAPPVILAALLIERPWTLGTPSLPVATALTYHIVLPMAYCYAVWAVLVNRLPAPVVATGTLLIPVVGVLSAVALLGEPLGWRKLLALLLVLASVALVLIVPERVARYAAADAVRD